LGRRQAENDQTIHIPLAIDLHDILQAHGLLPCRPPGYIDPLGEDHYNSIKEWNLEKHHRMMIESKIAAAQRRLYEAARKEAELHRVITTGGGSAYNTNHPLVQSMALSERVAQHNKKTSAMARRRGMCLKIATLKRSRELTRESLQGKSVREAIFDQLGNKETSKEVSHAG
jgi:hypothetical protein